MGPTKQQDLVMAYLQKVKGYKWDKEHSTSACAVVLSKGSDFWLFGLDGSIMHNPKPLLSINTSAAID
jgi:hypothetical protein